MDIQRSTKRKFMRRKTRDAIAVSICAAIIACGIGVFAHEGGKGKEKTLLSAAKRDLVGLRIDLEASSKNDYFPGSHSAEKLLLKRRSSSLFWGQEIYLRTQPIRKGGRREILAIARLGSRHLEVPNHGEIICHYGKFTFPKREYRKIVVEQNIAEQPAADQISNAEE